MAKFSDPVSLDKNIIVGVNSFGISEHGFWGIEGFGKRRWFPVCCTCGDMKHEAQVKGDTQCLNCDYLDEQPYV